MENSIRFLQLADWGGQAEFPYYNPSQMSTSIQMGIVGSNISAQFVLALGDNFYLEGIQGGCFNTRFEGTWNSVYSADSLAIDWYICAGNHDHYGNVTAQIEYSKLSSRWKFPYFYHKHSFFSEDKSVSLDIILIDTTHYIEEDLTGVQHQFVKASLQESVADYIIVGGHYPVYSVCEHGNTNELITDLKPLLEQYEAHYMSGHDHCAEHFLVNNINYWLNGIGQGCCYKNTNMETMPPHSLKYLMADTNNLLPAYQNEVNHTIGGFSSVIVTKDIMTVTYYNQNGTILYESTTFPRSASSPSSNIPRHHSPALNMISALMIGVAIGSTLTFLSLILLILSYYRKQKRRRNVSKGTGDRDGNAEDDNDDAIAQGFKPLASSEVS